MIMDDCVFCKIVAGKIPSSKVYENEDVLAFLDIAPATPRKGHVLVIPKGHFVTMGEMPEEAIHEVFSVVKKVSLALMEFCDGVNVIQNNGQAAGQLVPHFHVHVIPRYDKDGVRLGDWESYKYDVNEMSKMQDRIKKLLNAD